MRKNKSIMITFLLLLFFGLFGLHRIYLGKVRSAMMFILLTFLTVPSGMLGLIPCIWWWIDLIGLLNGKMTDADGNELE